LASAKFQSERSKKISCYFEDLQLIVLEEAIKRSEEVVNFIIDDNSIYTESGLSSILPD
jgi:hypothetical protein